MFGAHSKFAQALVGFCGAVLAFAVPTLCLALAAPKTQTTLSLSSSSVQIGTTVTLMANVTSGGAPVYPGLVVFCNADALYCEDVAVLGQAQLTPNGIATIHLRLGAGSYNIKAAFQGVVHTTEHSPTLRQPSSSAAQSLSVQLATSPTPTTTMLTVSKDPGISHQMTSTVLTPGGNPVAGGTVSFFDQIDGEKLLGSLPLSSSPQSMWFNISEVPIGNYFYQSASGDFNGDGIPDLILTQSGYFNPLVLLGKGECHSRESVCVSC